MQEFNVLRCYECQQFQVDIVKEARKWSCKVCDKKQMIQRVFFTSFSAKECREKVEDLRSNWNQVRESENGAMLSQVEHDERQGSSRLLEVNENIDGEPRTTSKWTQFLQNDDNDEDASRYAPRKSYEVLDDDTNSDCKSFDAPAGDFKFDGDEKFDSCFNEEKSQHEPLTSPCRSMFNTARTKPTQLKSHKVIVTPNINLQPSPSPPRKKFKQFEDDFDDFEFS